MFHLSWDVLQKDGQELKLLNSLLLSPKTIFPELQQAMIWLLKRDNLWILGLFWLVICSTAFSIRKNISCFGVFYKHGTYPSLTNVAKRKKFAQPSLASALVFSGSSGNKVQDCLRMTGTKFYLKEEWRGLHRWLHHMPFSCFSIWTTFIVSVFLMFLKNWEKYLLKACGWKLNKINQAWYRKLIKN